MLYYMFSKKGLHLDTLPLWYIGWKPRRKFGSRIRMDGSVVCTRDTTPRTEVGLKYGFTSSSYLIISLFGLFWYYLFYYMFLLSSNLFVLELMLAVTPDEPLIRRFEYYLNYFVYPIIVILRE